MDAWQFVEKIDKSAGMEEAPPAGNAEAISESRFEQIVIDALDGVGGTMLFKMTIDSGGDAQHVAAGSIGEGAARRFLILSMPASGGAAAGRAGQRQQIPDSRHRRLLCRPCRRVGSGCLILNQP